ncbi:hypothetical protein ACFFKU_04720 [Kineococcus gynurae]|uniref:Uncharacterized protein n=1 Tax=Kineococcus gynurae TaxID=452979 RepID=A0ABV5LR95_9ACTN
MRWEQLFDDLAARGAAEVRLDRAAEVADRLTAELAQIDLSRRFRASATVAMDLVDGSHVVGAPVAAGPGWLLLDAATPSPSPAQVLVVAAAVESVTGLGERVAAEPGPLESRESLVLALRAVARADATVLLRTRSGRHLRGRLSRVGADHVDVDLDGGVGTRHRRTVPFSALVCVEQVA